MLVTGKLVTDLTDSTPMGETDPTVRTVKSEWWNPNQVTLSWTEKDVRDRCQISKKNFSLKTLVKRSEKVPKCYLKVELKVDYQDVNNEKLEKLQWKMTGNTKKLNEKDESTKDETPVVFDENASGYDSYKYSILASHGTKPILVEDSKRMVLPVPSAGSFNLVFYPTKTKNGIIIQSQSYTTPLYMRVKVMGEDSNSFNSEKKFTWYERDTETSENLIIPATVLENIKNPKVFINYVSKDMNDFIRLEGENWLEWDSTTGDKVKKNRERPGSPPSKNRLEILTKSQKGEQKSHLTSQIKKLLARDSGVSEEQMAELNFYKTLMEQRKNHSEVKFFDSLNMSVLINVWRLPFLSTEQLKNEGEPGQTNFYNLKIFRYVDGESINARNTHDTNSSVLVICSILGDGDADLYINKGYNNLPSGLHNWKSAVSAFNDEIYLSSSDVKELFDEYDQIKRPSGNEEKDTLYLTVGVKNVSNKKPVTYTLDLLRDQVRYYNLNANQPKKIRLVENKETIFKYWDWNKEDLSILYWSDTEINVTWRGYNPVKHGNLYEIYQETEGWNSFDGAEKKWDGLRRFTLKRDQYCPVDNGGPNSSRALYTPKCAVLFKVEQADSENADTAAVSQNNYAQMLVGQPGVPFVLKAGEPIRDFLEKDQVQSYLYQCNWTNGFQDLQLKIDLHHGQVSIKLGHRNGRDIDHLNIGEADEINLNDTTDSNLSKDEKEAMLRPEVAGNATIKMPVSKHGVSKPTTSYINVKADNKELLMQSYNFSVIALANSSYSVTVLPKHRNVRIESGVETLLKLKSGDNVKYFYEIGDSSLIKSLELEIIQRHFNTEESLRKIVKFSYKAKNGLLLEGGPNDLPADEVSDATKKLVRYDEIGTFFKFQPMKGFFLITIENPLNTVDKKGRVIDPMEMTLKLIVNSSEKFPMNYFDYRSVGGAQNPGIESRIFRFQAAEDGVLSLSANSCFKNLTFFLNQKEPVFDQAEKYTQFPDRIVDQQFDLTKGESLFVMAKRTDKLDMPSPMLISSEFLPRSQPIFISQYFNLDPKSMKVTPNEKIIEVLFKLPVMSKEFAANHPEINRVQGRVGVYLSRNKEFMEMATRCDTRFMDDPHKYYDFSVYYFNYFGYRETGNTFNWNKRFVQESKVMVDAETVLDNGSGPIMVQAILQLYFYQIERQDLKINLSDFSVRIPYATLEVSEDQLKKKPDTVKPAAVVPGAPVAPVVPVAKPGQELNLNAAGELAGEKAGIGRTALQGFAFLMILGGLGWFAYKFCGSEPVPESRDAPVPQDLETSGEISTSTSARAREVEREPKNKNQEYEMTSTAVRDTRGARDEEKI